MKKSYINKISKKQQKKILVWRGIKSRRAAYLTEKYGFVPCEYCGSSGGYLQLDGHHIDKNRNNNTDENCYLCHRICHSEITDGNITVKQEDFQGEHHIKEV